MPLLACIDALPESAWSTNDAGRPFIRTTRGELAELCGIAEPALISSIRQWVMSQKTPRYAVAWSEAEDSDSIVVITRTGELTR